MVLTEADTIAEAMPSIWFGLGFPVPFTPVHSGSSTGLRPVMSFAWGTHGCVYMNAHCH